MLLIIRKKINVLNVEIFNKILDRLDLSITDIFNKLTDHTVLGFLEDSFSVSISKKDLKYKSIKTSLQLSQTLLKSSTNDF